MRLIPEVLQPLEFCKRRRKQQELLRNRCRVGGARVGMRCRVAAIPTLAVCGLSFQPIAGLGENKFSWASVLAQVKDQMENEKLSRRASRSALECNPLLSKVCVPGKVRYRSWLVILPPKGPLSIIIRTIVIMYRVLNVCQAPV